MPGEPREAPADPLIGEHIGHYRIVRELARGGMGVVYEALHERLGQRAAVKVLSAELAQDPDYQSYVDRFCDEARAVTVIQHPGIVRITDHGQLPSGIVYILMEYLEGESLWDRLARQISDHGTGLPVAAALRYTRQIASAVAAAHRKGILHRDLKLANVLLVSDPEVPGAERTKLIDFGIARFLDTPYRRTTIGTLLGTPAYMSPEQCQGQDVDHKSDVYALGVMLYEMLSGQPPFDGVMATVLIQQISAPPPELRLRVPGLPESVHHLVHGMLAKDPRQRPSMEQVVSRIQQWEAERERGNEWLGEDTTRVMAEHERPRPVGGGDEGAAAPRPRLPEPAPTRLTPPRPDRRRLLLFGGLGAGLSLLLLLVLWLLRR